MERRKCLLVGCLVVTVLFRFTVAGRCERISLSSCTNLGYNSTMMPNFMGHDNQLNADIQIRSFEPFLDHKCSRYIRLFVCSVFVPMCSEHVPRPIPACKGLCEKVKGDCSEAFRATGWDWPDELNCTRFPEPPALCMQQPPEDSEPAHHFDLDDFSSGSTRCAVGTASDCRIPCAPEEPQAALFEVCVAACSTVTMALTLLALATFIAQPKRFRWPARPVLYLTACGFITCAIYLVRWIEGPYTCIDDQMYEKPSASLSCVGISLILLFCDVAYSLWLTVFCFVWFLSAMKEWSTEAIEKISSRLHTIVWILSAVPMFYVLLSNNININYLSGFCEVRNKVLVIFQLFFMIVSSVLGVLTIAALRNVKKTLVLAGRSPLKLERLFYRLVVISLGIYVPHFMYLVFHFYNSFTIALLKLVLRNVSIIFATLWVYSPKTFEMWSNFFCFCKRKKQENKQKETVFLMLRRIFRKSNNKTVTHNNNPLLTNNSKNIVISERKSGKTIFSILFARSQQTQMPVSRV